MTTIGSASKLSRRLGVLLLAVTPGCTFSSRANPAFSLSCDDAEEELRAMAGEPKPMERPLIIIGGWNSPGPAIARMARKLRTMVTTPEDIHTVTVFSTWTFDSCATRVVDRVESLYPSADPVRTVDVDVIGLSMGGLVARYAALPEAPGGKRLRIGRLFTLASPHGGARMATSVTIDPRVRDMVAGSDFLTRLDEAAGEIEYEIVPYVRMGDGMVGAQNAAWVDGSVWWVPNQPLTLPHMHITGDPRLVADIARVVRGEEPLRADEWAALPE